MNHDNAPPPQDKDPKRITQQQAILRDIQPGEPSPDAAPFMLTTPDDTPPQGDDMPTEWTLETVVAELLRRGELSDSRMETITAWLKRHDAEIAEINTWRQTVLTPDQLGELFANKIDEKTHAHWEGIDAEYMRVSTLVSDISGKYGNAAFAMEKVNAMEGKINEVLAAQHVRDQSQKESTEAMNAMVDTFASGYIALLGIDPRKPHLPRLKTSVIDDIEKLEAEVRVAKERAELAEKHMDDMRVIQAGFVGQFTGETGLFAEVHDMREYFEKKRQREELVSEVLSGIKGLLKVPAFQAVAGAITGTGVVALFIKAIEVLSGVLP